ncbi:MAG: alpha-xylosidase [Clostridiales bacterium]|nr:alpha-xylosidase [Clostridiales bacterium]
MILNGRETDGRRNMKEQGMAMSHLPEYLRAEYNAKARGENIIVSGDVRITVITQRLIRIEQGVFLDDPTQCVICRDLGEVRYAVSENSGVLLIDTGALLVRLETGKPLDANSLRIESHGQPGFVWSFGQKPLFNLGGTTSTLDRVDGLCDLEDGVCSLDGYAVISDAETARILPDGWLAPREAAVDIYFFGYGRDYVSCVRDYQKLTGGPGLLPAFALGNWWSRYWRYTEEEYLSLMDRFRQEDVPLSVGIVDMDWHLTGGEGRGYHDGWTGFTWNRELFPDHRRFLAGIRERGLKTALNLHPAQGVRAYEDQYVRMAEAMGIDPDGKKTIPFNCLDPDFLKAYFEVLLFPYEQDGVDFWWLDWQQGNDYRQIAGDSYREEGLSSVYPLWMLNHMHSQASKRNGKRGMIFSRFAGYGSQRYPIGFSGDTVISWDSLDFQPYFTLTASNIGYGWWSHDIGGHFGGKRDDELNTRWIQLGVFSPVFRLHSTDNPFLGREPWNYNKRAELVIKDFMRLRHRLFPYLYTMNRVSAEELIPLIRPMYHMDPEEKEAYEVRNEYWFGSELIVAPVTSPADSCTGEGSTEVWLPAGTYIDAMTGIRYRGGQKARVFRPLERMPVFLKAGGIIPLQAHEEHGNCLGGSERITLVVAPGADGRFCLYEDDGETLDYQQGKFAETVFTYTESGDRAVLRICPANGHLPLIPQERQYHIVLRGVRPGISMSSAGRELAVSHDTATHTAAAVIDHVIAADGAEIQISCSGGILNDNSDIYDLCMDRITRAQCTLEIKDYYWRWLKQKIQRNERIDVQHDDYGNARMLYLSLCELLLQRDI